MNTNFSPHSFKEKHPLWYQLFLITFITLLVYLSFRYLLPLILPFVLAYLLMRMLLPAVRFLRQRWHLPSGLSYTLTLSAFFLALGGGITLLLWKLCSQLRLLFCNFPVYYQICRQEFSAQSERLCYCLDNIFAMKQGTSMDFFNGHLEDLAERCNELLSTQAAPLLASCFSASVRFFVVLFMTIISMIILCKDMPLLHRAYHNSSFYPLLHEIGCTLKKTGLAYLKSQCIIIAVIWLVCSCGLLLIKNPYAILLGLGISLFDAFPVLGSGFILVPWSIVNVFQRDYFSAAVLLTVLVLNILLRELLEAKLMGNNMGLIPFAMIISIYIGIYLFGIPGIFLGPFGTIAIQTLYKLAYRPASSDTETASE